MNTRNDGIPQLICSNPDCDYTIMYPTGDSEHAMSYVANSLNWIVGTIGCFDCPNCYRGKLQLNPDYEWGDVHSSAMW